MSRAIPELILAVLVKRLGGRAEITMKELIGIDGEISQRTLIQASWRRSSSSTRPEND